MKNNIIESAAKKELKTCYKNIRLAEQNLAGAPEGKLRISTYNGKSRAFHCTVDAKGAYIKKGNEKLKERLIMKEYYKKVLKESTARAKKLEGLLKLYENWSWDDILKKMNPAKQSYIKKDQVSNALYAAIWSAKEYDQKDPPPEGTGYRTDRGEYVRSKSELYIANKLHALKIPYRYEMAHYFKHGGVCYPDFTILDVNTREEIIYEHFGRIDDPEYRAVTSRKINDYLSDGYVLFYNFFYTIEGGELQFSADAVTNFLRHRF